MKKQLKIFLSFGIPLIILILPREWLGIEGLTIIEHRLIAIFLCALFLWVTELVPIYATSILIFLLLLLLLSDTALIGMRSALESGKALSYKNIMASFASPVIFLFLGGFYLAAAAAKYRLDINLARVILKPFGTNPKYIMFGLMLTTAVFSMFMSNTATAAMMLTILMPILKFFPKDDPGKIGFVLAIPFSANLGGMGTPIGTPPNAIALKYLTGTNSVTFAEWMTFGIPFVLCNLLFCWFLIWKFYPSKMDAVNLNIKGSFLKGWRAITIYVTFCVTILLWLTDFIHGINSYTVALIPVVVFSMTNIVSAKDMKSLNWDILWLLAGGIALGNAMEETGLARHLIAAIPFDALPPLLIISIAASITFSLANFMSRTATANLMLPIISAMGAALPSIAEYGSKLIILTATLSASLAMALPISTPPNAMAHATGIIRTEHMAKPALLIGFMGLAFLAVLMVILKLVNFV